MAVKFVRDCQQGTHYSEGEIASFDAEIEEQLIKQKFAVPHKSQAEAK